LIAPASTTGFLNIGLKRLRSRLNPYGLCCVASSPSWWIFLVVVAKPFALDKRSAEWAVVYMPAFAYIPFRFVWKVDCPPYDFVLFDAFFEPLATVLGAISRHLLPQHNELRLSRDEESEPLRRAFSTSILSRGLSDPLPLCGEFLYKRPKSSISIRCDTELFAPCNSKLQRR
jgi:hypothetical protein